MTATRQVALVTGASSGVGKAAAIALAAAGFQVIGTGRNTARVTAPAGVTYLDLDVTSDESVASVVGQVIDRFGHIDVLVNNAGVGATGAAEEFSVAQTQDVFDINVYGVMRMTKAVLPHMRAQRRGRIINVSSLSGFVPSPFMALYVSTKHAVEGYSESLDHEVRDHGDPGPARRARPDQHPVRGPQRAGRHPTAALRVGTAQLRRGAGEEHQRRRRSRRRGQGDRRGGHRPEPETAAHRRLDGPQPSTRCTASPRPGASTASSADSTGCRADRSPSSSRPSCWRGTREGRSRCCGPHSRGWCQRCWLAMPMYSPRRYSRSMPACSASAWNACGAREESRRVRECANSP